MTEAEMFKVTFEFKNGSTKTIQMTDGDVDDMFDKLWEREPIKWLNIWEDIINLDEVQHIYYEEVEEGAD